jgi:thiol-disulfide isomerase/thioredoxin
MNYQIIIFIIIFIILVLAIRTYLYVNDTVKTQKKKSNRKIIKSTNKTPATVQHFDNDYRLETQHVDNNYQLQHFDNNSNVDNNYQLQHFDNNYQLQHFDNNSNNDTIKITLFYANWCGHCPAVKKFIDEIKLNNPLQNKNLIINTIESKELENMPDMFDKVTGFPTIIINTKNKEIKYSGNRDKQSFINFISTL